MTAHTVYRTFNTDRRREFVRITDESGGVRACRSTTTSRASSRTRPSADEGLRPCGTLEWLDELAPPSWKEPANDVAAQLGPDPGDFRHHRGGEDDGDAHWKNLLVHHQVCDGGRDKRLVIKVPGE
jgi:thiamine phosphate synthase YjbQ (UPF0047 family)